MNNVYLSLDQAICDNEEEQQTYSFEFINSLTPSGMPEHQFCPKGWMLLRNLDIQSGACRLFYNLGIHLPAPVFSHGQLYVAFSRAKSFKDIYFNICETN